MPENPLRLPTIHVNEEDFFINFDAVIKDLGRVQKFTNDGFAKAVEGIEKSRQSAIKQIRQLYSTNRALILYNKKLSAKKKKEFLVKLSDAAEKSSKDINRFIFNQLKEARSKNKQLDASEAATEILDVIQEIILKQRNAAKAFIEMSRTAADDVNLEYFHAEQVIKNITQAIE